MKKSELRKMIKEEIIKEAKYSIGDTVYWKQRIGHNIKTLKGIIKKVDGFYLTISPRENSHESYWKRYDTRNMNFRKEQS